MAHLISPLRVSVSWRCARRSFRTLPGDRFRPLRRSGTLHPQLPFDFGLALQLVDVSAQVTYRSIEIGNAAMRARLHYPTFHHRQDELGELFPIESHWQS